MNLSGRMDISGNCKLGRAAINQSIGRCGTETHIFSLAAIGTQLYAGSYPTGTIWRYDGGTTWTSIGRCGTEAHIFSLAAIGTQLYAASSPTGTIWKPSGLP